MIGLSHRNQPTNDRTHASTPPPTNDPTFAADPPTCHPEAAFVPNCKKACDDHLADAQTERLWRAVLREVAPQLDQGQL